MSDNENWRVECDCGYTVEGLSEDRARRFAGQHGDDEHDAVAIAKASALTDADQRKLAAVNALIEEARRQPLSDWSGADILAALGDPDRANYRR